MPDLALSLNPDSFEFDLTLDVDPFGTDIQGDSGLLTAIIISLFTDRRALPDDPLPDERPGVLSDRRGWWGDKLGSAETPDDGLAVIGSRLWLLSREKEQASVVARAEQYAEEALVWLRKKGLARELRVKAAHVGPGHLGIAVEVLPVDLAGSGREWNFLYDYASAAPVKIQMPGVY